MGERSQIYVRAEQGKDMAFMGKYFQWNLGLGFVWTVKDVIKAVKTEMNKKGADPRDITRVAEKTIEEQFDYRHNGVVWGIVDIVSEWYCEELGDGMKYHYNTGGFKDIVFDNIECDDGKAFIDVNLDNNIIKFCFTGSDCFEDKLKDKAEPLDVKGYLLWNSKYIEIKNRNKEYLSVSWNSMTGEEKEEYLKNEFADIKKYYGIIDGELNKDAQQMESVIMKRAEIMSAKQLQDFINDRRYTLLPEAIEAQDKALQEARGF